MRTLILLLATLTAPLATAESTTCNSILKHGLQLMECIMRGEPAKEIIRSADANMYSYPVSREAETIFAWEFIGSEIDCAARTKDPKQMEDKNALMKGLAAGEALCVFYVNPQTTKTEKPTLLEESTAGVSNFF